MIRCTDCPRCCLAGRTPQSPGFCGVCAPPGSFRVARIMAHHAEEPYISGTKGSGAVFFSGCALRCVFCQNYLISQQGIGREMDQEALTEEILRLQSAGVHNLNLVTGSHYLASMPDLIRGLRARGLEIPVIWNSSAYESASLLADLAGLVDIYLPDLKFVDASLARQLAGAEHYLKAATRAIAEMVRQQPVPVFDKRGLLRRGTAVRHLVLPGQWRDSLQVIDVLAELVPMNTPFSIMSQYTPPPDGQLVEAGGALSLDLAKQMRRRITTYEYRKVIDHALIRGFTHILGQDRTSAVRDYTPDFLSD